MPGSLFQPLCDQRTQSKRNRRYYERHPTATERKQLSALESIERNATEEEDFKENETQQHSNEQQNNNNPKHEERQ
ncbi:unnamed protein product [Didymodactylos carnosus]|uniref:Uncharacterized protein n=1 Tax=Didymodactylos carnosus TaxID=1234261 RepID=A0A814TVM8_9BILA|nr:unnamed protein product [Didymodactylos carnosus]CAF1166886.1 unnamed protein product [Didymodactylos carnosus]CAF3674639.1 unnamed protein product [Didymodactylos carnosus]CAF3930462.1 unnamed protein product [Didymodactylos carnosus]